MSLPVFFVSGPVINVNCTTAKCVVLPQVETVPGQTILVRDSSGLCSPSQFLRISSQRGNNIDFLSNTVTLTSAFASARFTTFGTSDWAILQGYPLAYPPVFLGGWQPLSNGDGSVSITSNLPASNVTLRTIGPNNGPGQGYSFAYLYIAQASGSFTYNFTWSTIDGIAYDWPFEALTSNAPAITPSLFTTKIATSNFEQGVRTVSWSNYIGGVYVSFGVYSVDSLFGPGSCVFSNMPYGT